MPYFSTLYAGDNTLLSSNKNIYDLVRVVAIKTVCGFTSKSLTVNEIKT